MASTSKPGLERRGWRASRPAALLAALTLAGAASGQAAGPQQACAAGASSLPSTRFKDNGDGTVTDVESKLMWMRCASGQQWVGQRCTGRPQAYSWADARQQAEQLSAKGAAFFNDWRVPALRDLATITDRACKNPRTNLTVFPGTPAAPFWTSTPRPGEQPEERAFALSFGAEGVVLARKDERFPVRFVRSAL